MTKWLHGQILRCWDLLSGLHSNQKTVLLFQYFVQNIMSPEGKLDQPSVAEPLHNLHPPPFMCYKLLNC